jgi:hypothetical protein
MHVTATAASLDRRVKPGDDGKGTELSSLKTAPIDRVYMSIHRHA